MLKITELRKEKGLTQGALANKLNISVKKLGAWEQGRAEPSIEDLCLLASFFDCTLDELVGRLATEGPVVGQGLTPFELALLREIRKLGEKEQHQALNIVKVLQQDND